MALLRLVRPLVDRVGGPSRHRRFTPVGLYANGEVGCLYDPQDLATLFQDSAGTTPVTAVGQPIGKIVDKSGRGNHATQATAGSRPLLQQDANGNYYLAFDGTDDFLAFTLANMAAVTVVAASQNDAAASRYVLTNLGTTTGAALLDRGTATTASQFFAGNGTTLAVIGSNGAVNVPHVGLGSADAAGRRVRMNLAAATADPTTAVLTGTSWRLGRTLTDTGALQGRFYGGLVLGRLMSTAEEEAVIRHYGRKASITIP